MVDGRKTLKKKFKKNFITKNRFKILIPLILILIMANLALEQDKIEKENDLNVKTVKVLVYAGTGTSDNCVFQIKNCLEESNSRNLTSHVKFTFNTTKKINNQTLKNYDVLIMPGSSDVYDYLDNSDINVDDLKSFVASGKGFLGICAGAYSGAANTESGDTGWGIAPHIINQYNMVTGNLTINVTSEGNQLFGYGGSKVISHINGPAMYSSDDEVKTFATYADGNTSYNGSAAIVGDYYGEGRTVLSGVHPELEPQDPEMLVYLILWAYNGTYNNESTNSE
jgi:glutamine amidotransferase-like uncharacterized protein